MPVHRRKFLHILGGSGAFLLIGSSAFAGSFIQKSETSLTIQQVIDIVIASVSGAPFPKTIDTIKAGNPNQPVTGIVTTMFATVEVIEKAAAAGANFIIAHEPVFYNHADDTQWLEKDAVFQYKSALLKKHNIVVWRCHDYAHAHRPDGVISGTLDAMGWSQYADAKKPYLVNIPQTNLQSVISTAKEKLGIEHLRYIGNLQQPCSRIVFIPGAAGLRMHVNAVENEKPDVLIIGELDEWETSEYIRDLQASGSKTALVVLGHIVSEEQGSAWMAGWLQSKLKDIPVTHIPSGDAFSWM